ncbi:hypothetical protein F5Y18DRAFT_428457 [Xylariaceae sp. FL1019]|nr:hypothetical protein F5Y18DRAFT_428457 [Xylariaceae sp. FL1019]
MADQLTVCGSSLGNHDLAGDWSRALASQSNVVHGFATLRQAVRDYNLEASKDKRDVIETEAASLEATRKIAETLQITSSQSTSASKPAEKIKHGLQKFCETSLYYSAIVDTFIQHNPEWTALAWGAIKFLIIVPVEYQRIKEKIALHLGSLGEKFRIVHIFVQFFPSTTIVKAASEMYAAFARFLEKSIAWLKTSQLKRIIKAALQPYDTSLKPILDSIDQAYANLKEQVEVHRFLRDTGISHQVAQNVASLQSFAVDTREEMSRMRDMLKVLCSAQRESVQVKPELQASPLINVSKKVKSKVMTLPDFNTRKSYLNDVVPLDHDLETMRIRQTILPIAQYNEGLRILIREDFSQWITMPQSGILWIDGYDLPGRASWMAEFALSITHASLLSGYEALYSFSTAHYDTQHAYTPLSFAQRFSCHLLVKYPDIQDRSHSNFVSGQAFLAAKTDFNISWEIFLECLRLATCEVVYVIIESLDILDYGSNVSQEVLMKRLLQLATPNFIPYKRVKIIFTTTRPAAGLFEMFHNNSGSDCNNLLIRVAPVTARVRKPRSILSQKKRARSSVDKFSLIVRQDQKLKQLNIDDFDPMNENEVTFTVLPNEIESELEDLDIYDVDAGAQENQSVNTQETANPLVSSKPVLADSPRTSRSSFDIYEWNEETYDSDEMF